ncbi:Ribokinase-like protein [Hortaea werneckii]|nr:Ribokinase-like protein [Hortaea werneckii]
MASDLGSAIDDSFEPNFFYYQPSKPYQDDNQSWYNGPRSGHWSVSSSIGSAIDDRCPTVWGPDSMRDSGNAAEGAPLRPIDGDLLRRIGRTAIEEKIAEAAAEEALREQAPSEVSKHETSRPEIVAPPAGFYIPKTVGGKDLKRQKEAAKSPLSLVPPRSQQANKQPKPLQGKPSVVPKQAEKTASVRSLKLPPPANIDQIKGKDGREAVVPTTRLPRVPTLQDLAPEAIEKIKARAKAEALRKREEQKRERDARVAAEALMFRAIPGNSYDAQSKQWEEEPIARQQKKKKAVRDQQNTEKQQTGYEKRPSELRVESGRKSAKDSAVGLPGLFSLEPAAGSVRSDGNPISAKSLSQAVKNINANSRQNEMATNAKCEKAAGKTVGWSVKNGSQHSKVSAAASRSSHRNHALGSPGWDQPEHMAAQVQVPNVSRQSSRRSPTIFAGKGWISPHPLSRSSSPFASPPQSHISIPKGDGRTMSYDEWKAVQGGHRNFSRTSSYVSKRVSELAASIAQEANRPNSPKASGRGSQAYHKATVESEQGSQHRPSITSLKESVKAISQHSKQSARWTVFEPAEDEKATQWDEGKADGWGELPRFDGILDHNVSSVLGSSKAYEKHLSDILKNHRPHRRGDSGAMHDSGYGGPKVHLEMPWDRTKDGASAAKPAPRFQPSTIITMDTSTPPAFQSPGSVYGRMCTGNDLKAKQKVNRTMVQGQVAVIGSLNVDFITRTPRVPEGGETLTVTSFDTGFGGKGANQAVACARLAGEDVKVSMIGNVGDDLFGNDYFEALKKEGIDGSKVRKLKDQKTGIANIVVEDGSGENRIMFASHANYAFSKEPSAEWEMVPDEAEVVVFQLELPLAVVLHNMEKARKAGKHVLLNPAPASVLPDSAYQNMDTLVMNESESAICAGGSIPKMSPEELAKEYLKKGVKDAVIITLGGNGLVFATAAGASGRVEANKVKVVDTTAAGDTFVGGYAVQLAKQKGGEFDYRKALEFATLAASKSVQKNGAMAAIPYLKDL